VKLSRSIGGSEGNGHPAPPRNVLDPLTLMQNFSPWQQISIALAILTAVFYFALQIPWVAALFG
jgi:hypothetical protein